jgi:Domain of unknown function (DUF6468)
MAWIEWGLQIAVLVLLLGAMPFALRLERELRALRQDRGALDGSAKGLTEASRLAEAASIRLRATAEAAGRGVAEKLAAAEPLRDDLRYLVERAEALADRLDGLVRTARPIAAAPGRPMPQAEAAQAMPSQAERDLLRALRVAR